MPVADVYKRIGLTALALVAALLLAGGVSAVFAAVDNQPHSCGGA